MQCLLAVNTGTLAILEEPGSTDLALPHDLPLPEESTEPLDKDPPKQILAPTDVRGLMESP
jgi:hypothetical protein